VKTDGEDENCGKLSKVHGPPTPLLQTRESFSVIDNTSTSVDFESLDVDDVANSFPSSKDPVVPLTDRERIVQEILETEISFRNFLIAQNKTFATRLPKELSANEHKLCFGHADQLLSFSELFMKELQTEISESGKQLSEVGKIYCKLSPFFKMYTAYASVHFQISQLIEDLYRKKERFKKICDECKEAPECKGQTLQSLLIMPIQRIPRHVLLLKELRKNTEQEHPDSKHIDEAQEKLREIADLMNREIGDMENRIKLLELQRKMKPQPELFKTGRMLLRSGMLKKRAHDGSMQDLMFFLMTDCLVYAKPLQMVLNGVKFQFRRMIQVARVNTIEAGRSEDETSISPLSSSMIEMMDGIVVVSPGEDGGQRRSFSSDSSPSDDSSTVPSEPVGQGGADVGEKSPANSLKSRKDLFPFKIHGTKSFILFASSEEERQSWLSDLELNSDPNVMTDIELREQKLLEEKQREIKRNEEKMKDMKVSDPVRVCSATAWFKLNMDSSKSKSFKRKLVETTAATGSEEPGNGPELQLKFLISKTGIDLSRSGAVAPFSILSMNITVISARNIASLIAAATTKGTQGVYCQIIFGKTINRTRCFNFAEDPTWMEEFHNMSFLAGFHSTLQVRVKVANTTKYRKEPVIASVDLCIKDILGYTGVEVDSNEVQKSVIKDESSRAIQRKFARMKQAKGVHVSSSTLTDSYKLQRIRPITESLPTSLKPLPPTPPGSHAVQQRNSSEGIMPPIVRPRPMSHRSETGEVLLTSPPNNQGHVKKTIRRYESDNLQPQTHNSPRPNYRQRIRRSMSGSQSAEIESKLQRERLVARPLPPPPTEARTTSAV